MPLFDPNHNIDHVDPADAVIVVDRFLRRARQWSRNEIARRMQSLSLQSEPEEAAKLYQWVSYLAFTDYTLRELAEGELDPWFQPGAGEEAAEPEP